MKTKTVKVILSQVIAFCLTNFVIAQSVQIESPFPERFDSPLGFEYSHSGSDNAYVVGQKGIVYKVDVSNPESPSETWIDISERVLIDGGEMGLLGMTFHPDYPATEIFFLYYTFGDAEGNYYSTLARYRAPGGVADPESEERLLVIDQPNDNHNGGQIAFGPDGYLYLAVGDGGRNSRSNGQNTLTLNGSILRIDVSLETGYAIPPDNPFVGNDEGLDEIYAWGFRNPWRMSFDPVTGNLWVGDVGQKDWESVHIVDKGKNYGWSIIEGSECYPIGTECDKTGLELPLFQYPWDEKDTGKSITGGYVYRGSNNPSLYGKYIYGDFISRKIWALEVNHDTREVISNTEIAESSLNIPSFGIDSRGEIYILGWGSQGRIFTFQAEEPLSESGAVSVSSPGDGSEGESVTPELVWLAVDGAESYDVQVSESGDFSSPVVDLSGEEGTSVALGEPLGYETEYFWRVRGVNQAGAGEWSEVWSFTTEPEPLSVPGVVSLSSPGDGAEGVSVSPLLEWLGVDVAESYDIQVSGSGDFSSPVVDLSGEDGTMVAVVDPLGYETVYFWRVAGVNQAGSGGWSDVWSFTTRSIPGIANLTLTEQQNSIQLSWDIQEDSGIMEYRIYRGSNVSSLQLHTTLQPGNRQYTASELPQGSIFYALTAVGLNQKESDLSNFVSYYNTTMEVSPEWQVVSIPIEHSGIDLSGSSLFEFERVYHSESTMLPLKGYWIKSSNGEQFEARGTGIEEAELNLNRGWNLIGGLIGEIPVKSIVDPSGILTEAPIFGYENGMYQEVSVIEPARGYWIYAGEKGNINLSISSDVSVAKPAVTNSVAEEADDVTHPDRIIFTNSDSEFHFYSADVPDQEGKLRYLMPPKAPAARLDVRTEAGYRISDSHSTELRLTTPDYPIEVEAVYESDRDYVYRIVAEDDHGNHIHFNLLPGSKQAISKEYASFTLERIQTDELIIETSIEPNYPNPFNPVTNIRYRLAQESDVQIGIYDVTGRRVASLVNEVQQTGAYTLQFDGSSLASGIYLLRIRTDDYVNVQKFTLIK